MWPRARSRRWTRASGSTKRSRTTATRAWRFRGELVRRQPLGGLVAGAGEPHRRRLPPRHQAGKTIQATAGFYYDAGPVFDPEGKYLFLLTNRNFRPVYGNLDPTWIYANLTRVAAVPLRADVASPLAPKNDVEGEDEQRTEADKKEARRPRTRAKKGQGQGEEGRRRSRRRSEPVEIDLTGFEQRMVLLPPKAGNYDRARRARGQGRSTGRRRDGLPEDEKTPADRSTTSRSARRRPSSTTWTRYVVAAGGEKLLVAKKEDWAIVDAKPDQKMEKKLATCGLEMTVDPRGRVAPDLHRRLALRARLLLRPRHARRGLERDADALRQRCSTQCVTRCDVNFVLGELIGELNSSHTYRGGGDLEKPAEARRGPAGLRLRPGERRLPHREDLRRRARGTPRRARPSREPGVDVKEGDYLLAVNGIPVDTAQGPVGGLRRARGQDRAASRSARQARHGRRPQGPREDAGGREAAAQPGVDRGQPREGGRRPPAGKLGYIYVPDTGHGRPGRALPAVHAASSRRRASSSTSASTAAARSPTASSSSSTGPSPTTGACATGRTGSGPEFAHAGPKVMLINGWSGSGGDCFPLYFRMAKLGPLVGRRTWGGLIGISGSPGLVDGGVVTVPTFGIYSTDGKWSGGHGVDRTSRWRTTRPSCGRRRPPARPGHPGGHAAVCGNTRGAPASRRYEDAPASNR